MASRAGIAARGGDRACDRSTTAVFTNSFVASTRTSARKKLAMRGGGSSARRGHGYDDGVFVAITRAVSPAIASCELTHLARAPIDVERAREQHRAYEQALIAAGGVVERLESDEAMPDAVFVEDVAIVFDELAVITRPGAASRRRETVAVADALA